jgi:hypothetical protein
MVGLKFFCLPGTWRFPMVRNANVILTEDLVSQGGVLFFMIKQKIIRDKMRFSNLSNNMMISEL